ncbi:nucleotidyltransferase family protein [Catenovulum sp. 2E275]|nr:nucleotidyltransferase family protein [Catenovulum sp. 2E275]
MELLTAQHLPLQEQTKLLSEFVMTINGIPQILDCINALPNAWVGAGIIFQNVWNMQHGFEKNRFVKDIDILYWDDLDLSWESENHYIDLLAKSLPNLNIEWDVKNIARVHLWYEDRFGIAKKPYVSIQESIASWPVLGACMAMRMQNGQIEFIAPYGFQDMLSLRVRPNKILVNQKIYQEKADRWKMQWPKLTVEDW